jgi:NADPH:quinone reductase-like Zn-dependent oxidoreductase
VRVAGATYAALEREALPRADIPYVKNLGAAQMIDYRTMRFEDAVPPLDFVFDTVGGDTRQRSCRVLKPGGTLVSVVTPFPKTGQHPSIQRSSSST